jgi:energy-coupling factor transporter transmembrane protein EcfT
MLDDIKKKEEWLKIIYTEAWNQYAHEDDLGQGRMNIFLIVHTTFFAIISIVAEPLLNNSYTEINGKQYYFGIGSLGLIMIFIGIFTFILAKYWKSANTAGGRYLHTRWLAIASIEIMMDLDEINLANLESNWKKHNQEFPSEKYYPFPNNEKLKEFYLDPLPKISGWSSMEKTIALIQGIDVFILIIGFLLLEFAISLSI